MSVGSFGCWAMKAGDFHAREFDGTPGGLASAIAYAGTNGTVQVYPGNTGITVPAIPAGVRVVLDDLGRQRVFTAGGEVTAQSLNARDFPSVQAAVDALSSTYGGEVLLPPGQLDATTTPAFTGVTLTSSKCLRGAAGGGSILKQSNANANAITINGAYCGVYDLQIIGANAAGSGHGIQVAAGSTFWNQYINIERVIITQTPQWGLDIAPISGGFGAAGIRATDVVIDGNVATDAGSVRIGQASNNNDFIRCQFNGINTTGTYSAFGSPTIEMGIVHIDRAVSNRFFACRWENGGAGSQLSMKATSWDVQLHGCYMELPATGTRTHACTVAAGMNGFLINGMKMKSHSTAVGIRLLKTTTGGGISGGAILNCIAESDATSVATDDVSLGGAGDEVLIHNSQVYYTNAGIAAYKPMSVTGAGAALPIIASAATLTIPPREAEVFVVSAANPITSITASRAGRVVTLIFSSTAQVTDGSNILLAGNFTGGANRVLRLVCDGTNWIEMSRSTN